MDKIREKTIWCENHFQQKISYKKPLLMKLSSPFYIDFFRWKIVFPYKTKLSFHPTLRFPLPSMIFIRKSFWMIKSPFQSFNVIFFYSRATLKSAALIRWIVNNFNSSEDHQLTKVLKTASLWLKLVTQLISINDSHYNIKYLLFSFTKNNSDFESSKYDVSFLWQKPNRVVFPFKNLFEKEFFHFF